MAVAIHNGIITEGLTFNVDSTNDKSRLGPNLITNSKLLSAYAPNQNVTVTQNGQYVQAVSNQTTSTPGVWPIGGNITVLPNTYYTFRVKAFVSYGTSMSLYINANVSGQLTYSGSITSTLQWYEVTVKTGASDTILQVGILWSGPILSSTVQIEDSGLHQVSTWYDLSSNKIDMQLSGTLNYTPLGGVPCFAFNSSMYWYSTVAKGQLTDYRYGATIELWLYSQTTGTRRTIFEKAPNTYQSYEQELAMTWETGGNISWYRHYSAYDSGACAPLNTNAWNHVVLVLYPYLGTIDSYLNGVASGTTSSNSTRLPPQANEIRIGTGYAGVMDNCGVAVARTYSKMFTASDVQQNYLAMKSKFGL